MNLKDSETKELLILLAITIIVASIFSFAIFGITGLRVFFGLIAISLPFYFILNNFELAQGEKFVFSILMGLTLFSSIVYLLGLVISFRMAILITFIIFITLGIGLRKYMKG